MCVFDIHYKNILHQRAVFDEVFRNTAWGVSPTIHDFKHLQIWFRHKVKKCCSDRFWNSSTGKNNFTKNRNEDHSFSFTSLNRQWKKKPKSKAWFAHVKNRNRRLFKSGKEKKIERGWVREEHRKWRDYSYQSDDEWKKRNLSKRAESSATDLTPLLMEREYREFGFLASGGGQERSNPSTLWWSRAIDSASWSALVYYKNPNKKE